VEHFAARRVLNPHFEDAFDLSQALLRDSWLIALCSRLDSRRHENREAKNGCRDD
jgi:hypothetical protein